MSLESRRQIILDLGFREAAFPQLQAYLELLIAANEELNLVSRKLTLTDIVDNHVIDCLLPLSKFPTDLKCVADFGSGGGLPSVIYAIQFPEIRFQLFEKSNLKQDFLKKCQKIAPNLEVKADIPLILKDVELVTARAFKPIDVILQMSRDHYLRGGQYFLLKGRREKIADEIKDAAKVVKDPKIEVEVLQSPVLEVERHLVWVRR